jgi:hypothetical protein
VPAPTIVKVAPLIVATFGSEEVNVHAPVESEVGAFNVKGPSPTVAESAANVPNVGIAPKTRTVI